MDWKDLMKGVGDSLAGTAAALHQFGQHQLGPALGEAGKALNHFGEHQLAPAVGEVGKALNHFGEHQLAPAVGEVGKALNEFGKDKLAPAIDEVGKALGDFGINHFGPAVGEAGKALEEFARDKLGPAMQNTGTWIEQHPAETVLFGTSLLTFMFPSIVYAPILSIFGWGSTGVRAGSTAAAIQSTAGPIVAGSPFATVQSAAMGGYGSMLLGAVVRATSAVLGAAGFVNVPKATSEKGEGAEDDKERKKK